MKKYTVEKTRIPSGGRNMKLLVLRPTISARTPEKTPGILWIHGGGYATGMASMIYMSRAIDLVKKYGAVVVTPEYRLAGKAPYPAALEDCYEALKYLKNHAGLPPAYTFVGDKEAFYCETLTYIDNLKKAGIPAHVDVYLTGFHAFDMLLPFRKISKQAIAEFEKQYLYAAEHYFAEQIYLAENE